MTRWPLLAVVCAVLAGCGRGDDERSVTQVTERFVTAVESDDGDVACAQLSADTADALASDEGEPCAQAARGLDIAASEVRRARVYGLSAKVDLADGDSAFLELTREGWRVAAAGCRPVGGDQPYECEVEA
ncbi:MAG TPA: hypothetical protein VFZ00_28240 [Solirubrobacter sp.]|nr:hypothetical protein [Solirubrobacter sp.]